MSPLKRGGRRTVARTVGWVVAVVAGGVLAYGADRLLDPYYVAVVGFVGIFIILATSLNLTNGYTGMFSLGHPAFMAVGAYTAALLTFPAARKPYLFPSLPDFLAAHTVPFPLALVAGAIMAAALALVVGVPVVRLRGHYLALATLAVIIVVSVLLVNLRNLTRGPLGINGIPPYTTLLGTYGWVVVTLYLLHRIVSSSYGRALMAIREDPAGAAALGIAVARYRLLALTIGAAFAGVAGGLWAHLITAITPASFSVAMAFQLVVMVVVGGAGSFWGPVVSASFLTLLTELLRPFETRYQVYGISQIVAAAVLLVFLAVRPQGLIPAARGRAGLADTAAATAPDGQPGAAGTASEGGDAARSRATGGVGV